jgi:hypothetical protein
MPLDKQQVKALRKIMQEALDKMVCNGDLSGASVSVGNAHFSDGQVSFKVEIAATNSNGEVMTETVAAFKRMATLYGLQPTDLGRSFRQSGIWFKVSGLAPRSHKYPILCEKLSDRRVYKFNERAVLTLLQQKIIPPKIV